MSCRLGPAVLMVATAFASMPWALSAMQEGQTIKVMYLGDPQTRPAVVASLNGEHGDEVVVTSEQPDVLLLNVTGLSQDSDLSILARARQGLANGRGLVILGIPSEVPAALGELLGVVPTVHDACRLHLLVLDNRHPITAESTAMELELPAINSGELPSDCRPLLGADQDGAIQPYVWVRPQGRGRLVVLLLPPAAWKHEPVRSVLRRAVQWAARRLDDPKPFRYRQVDRVPVYGPGRKVTRQTRMQEPLAPVASARRYTTMDRFRVELFASEPQIKKPLAMTFGPRGRLWIIESTDYPNRVLDHPERNGSDRIVICEDADGDGKADRFTVFADKLNIPTGLVHTGDALIVACAPHILVLRDTDGDDRADERTILFTGFGRADTHAVHANLHLGLDNWIWATVGYSGGTVRVGGREIRFRQGVFRFRPDGSEFEFVAPTTNNTWGLGISPEGDVFVSTANNQHAFYLAIPNRYFEQVRGWYELGIAPIDEHKKYHPIGPYRQVDYFGAFTAASGYNFYGDELFPEPVRRGAFVCEPTGHLIHLCLPQRHGSHFLARNGYNLLASDDEWAAPIAAAAGPDGAIWFLDWYNFIVQHNPTPPGFETGKGNAYVTPLRDKTHGRIYRIVSPLGTRWPLPAFDRMQPARLVEQLHHPSQWWRMRAQWELVTRRALDQIPVLVRIVQDHADSLAALHAIWTLEGLGVVERPEVVEALRHAMRARNAAVRRAAVQVFPRTAELPRVVLESELLADPDGRVRLAALLALSEAPPSRPVAALLVDQFADPQLGQDRWLPLAATIAAANHGALFLTEALASSKDSRPLLEACQVVAEHVARAGIDTALAVALIQRIGAAPADVATAVTKGLLAGWPEGQKISPNEVQRRQLAHVLRKLRGPAQANLILLYRRAGLQELAESLVAELRKRLLAQLASPELSPDQRLATIDRLLLLDPDEETVRAVVAQIRVSEPPAFNERVLQRLSELSADAVATELLSRWATLTPTLRRAVVALCLRRPSWSRALLDALAEGQISVRDLTLDQRQALMQHPDQAIAERAAKLLKSSAASSSRSDVLNRLLPLAERDGDPARGQQVFEKNCAKCHRFGEIGNAVGPDLSGLAARSKHEILADILDPNRSVEGNFTQYLVLTTDGRVLTGLLAAESRAAVELIDNEGQRHVVLREEIEAIRNSGKSLMPEGFEEQLSEQELVDLLSFLTARRRFVPLSLRAVATITSVRGMFYSRDAQRERLVFRDWGPKRYRGIPFHLVDPRSGTVPNVVLLHSPIGAVSRTMPRSVALPCNLPARAIHLLSGVAGWGYPASPAGSVSMVVRLHYADGQVEEHKLINGVHMADYIRVVDVPGSELAFKFEGGQQIRYLKLEPKRTAIIRAIEFAKGNDNTAPIVMAVTIELSQ